jgi:hypothetical protein
VRSDDVHRQADFTARALRTQRKTYHGFFT